MPHRLPNDAFAKELRAAALALIQEHLPDLVAQARRNADERALRWRRYMKSYMRKRRAGERAAKGGAS